MTYTPHGLAPPADQPAFRAPRANTAPVFCAAACAAFIDRASGVTITRSAGKSDFRPQDNGVRGPGTGSMTSPLRTHGDAASPHNLVRRA